ncbi:MAG: 2'-5' RNA ligase family protein [Proteobacteria bacterium]|nr:MAG: 2'-5' RNA ligase family protein [Pseudomonadota bacterium]
MTVSHTFPSGDYWEDWMKDFRFGGLIFVPSDGLYEKAGSLRVLYDPDSARTSPPHLTITQPFTSAPTDADLARVRQSIRSHSAFQIQIGPGVASPNGKMIWLDAKPSQPLVELRESLHALGLFRTDLPFTRGFIPHLTLSEKPRPSEEVVQALETVERVFDPELCLIDRIIWSTPDEHFFFQEREVFRLGSNRSRNVKNLSDLRT